MPEKVSRNPRLVVGLISGTSMDGIDAALVRISGPATQPRVRLIAFETLAYSLPVRQVILRIAAGEATTAGEISQLNFLLGELFAEAALRVCRKAHVSPSRLAAIGSHGQTIYHQGAPTREGRSGGITSTLQIAEPSVIAERTGAPVVADFRPADMAAGGQGAPLVPMVDYLLLRDARKGTVALNIGGIANFTVIPAGAKPEEVFGFDTGPGNMIIDGLVRHFTKGQKAYDAGGRWAAKGQSDRTPARRNAASPLFRAAASQERRARAIRPALYSAIFPCLRGGRRPPWAEGFGPTMQSSRAAGRSAPHRDRVNGPHHRRRARTLCAGKIAIHRLIISGGGAHNRLLVARLTELLPRLARSSLR